MYVSGIHTCASIRSNVDIGPASVWLGLMDDLPLLEVLNGAEEEEDDISTVKTGIEGELDDRSIDATDVYFISGGDVNERGVKSFLCNELIFFFFSSLISC